MTIYTKTCLGKCGKIAQFTNEDSDNDKSLPYKVFVCDRCSKKFSLQSTISLLHKDGHILYEYVLQNYTINKTS